MKTTFRKFGPHSLKGVSLPDGRFFPDPWDAMRILVSLLGMPPERIERMPKVDSPLDAAGGLQLILNETRDRPETIAFQAWLDSLTGGEEGYDSDTVIEIFRHFGRDITGEEISQSLLESPETIVVVDGGGVARICSGKTGELLAECREL